MSLRINDIAPDFTAETTQGTINLHSWIGDGWAILFSHPKDFTPVCTTELGAVAGLQDDFAARNCKIIGISVDGVSDHKAWSKDIESSQGHAVTYPLIGDPKLEVVGQAHVHDGPFGSGSANHSGRVARVEHALATPEADELGALLPDPGQAGRGAWGS